ncbi:hypothetical protein H2203_004106 [Taxawa tesnikishii (nom. ined.)]|nr:hypothetical protein H2203_004106 [Dothideales sp. JES 119]
MAFNNYFFFDSLSPSPEAQALNNYDTLATSLEKGFGSIDNLKQTLLDTAAAMFGPGFVWLVWSSTPGGGNARSAGWRILTTYNAGTPFSEAGYRQQGVDMNTQNATTGAQAMYRMQAQHNTIQNAPGIFGSSSRSGQEAAAYPLHVYLTDYTVEGKRRYLNNWWECIDWGTVDRRTPPDAKRRTMSGSGVRSSEFQ